MKNLKCVVERRHWSGHGEGGTIATLVIRGWRKDNIVYDSSPKDYKEAEEACAYVNMVLEDYENTLHL